MENYFSKYTFQRKYICPCGERWTEKAEIKRTSPRERDPSEETLARLKAIRSTCPKCKGVVPPPVCPECGLFVEIEKDDWRGSSLDDTAYEEESIYVKCSKGHRMLVATRFDSER